MTDVRIRKPTERTCERCGRQEVWTDDSWRVAEVDGERATGSTHCIHEWDIDGAFLPFELTGENGEADA
ncbi:hypothetical protein SAMN04487948_105339 [Halogranum amylolyticum]|uniref:HEWD domain-containing protein n=1 Tax=Halogranum amylolyticum TaxID=660520 RepID=A0A1H8STV2_9EURY|nr:HEWD family protein [Halogranum amylolyticum]SEO82399.1 hypothetical protein SAMN04487948_105339 [Halogranum amylolyticum]